MVQIVSGCDVANTDTGKPTLVTYLITDLILLLMMLLGLSRLRTEGGMFALGRLLWGQVRLWHFSLLVMVTA
jgi:hypothetical protein